MISREEFLQCDLSEIIEKCKWDSSKNLIIDNIITDMQSSIEEIPDYQYSIKLVGSHGKGTQIFSSDVDIAILFENSVTMTKEECFDYVKNQIEKQSIMQVVNEKSSAIGCQLNNMSVDIVPAKRHSDGSIHLYVTDEGEKSKMTDFDEHVQRAATSRYSGLIKLVKIWASIFDVRKKLKSFLLETLILDLEEENLLYGDLYDQFFYTMSKLQKLKRIEVLDNVNSRSLKRNLSDEDYEYIKVIVEDTLLNYIPSWCNIEDKTSLKVNSDTYTYKVFFGHSPEKIYEQLRVSKNEKYATVTNMGEIAERRGALRGNHNGAQRETKNETIIETVKYRGFHFIDFEASTDSGVHRTRRMIIHKK